MDSTSEVESISGTIFYRYLTHQTQLTYLTQLTQPTQQTTEQNRSGANQKLCRNPLAIF